MSTTTNTRRTSPTTDRGFDLRSTLGQASQKAPRRLGSWAASILFISLVVVGLVAVFDAQGDRVEVLAVTTDVAAGQMIEANDLRPVEVAGVPGAVEAAQIDSVIGKRAAAGLVEGQVLTDAALSDAAVPGDGESLVALQLPTGRVPGGLGPGDIVNVLAVPTDGATTTPKELQNPPVLAESARVESVGSTPEGNQVVTVLVAAEVAEPVAAYSATGRVTIVQAPTSAARE
jgi:hypothetical protein